MIARNNRSRSPEIAAHNQRNAQLVPPLMASVPARATVIRARARGRFFNLVDLVNQLEQEKAAGRSGRLAEKLLRHDLIVIDELGYLPFIQSGGQLLFHLISKLYETRRC
jgi:DNA replication protein DnaC